ncbi:MAG: M28 family peptidase [Armatimonadetes bacterium]|nr:M28 family peptidase [Armatimonadota bacterium]
MFCGRYRVWLALAWILSVALTAHADVRSRDTGIHSWRIWSHIYKLASEEFEGRGSGTKGNELAAYYIAERFAEYGLKPVGTSRYHDLQAPMDGSGYFQPFRVYVGAEAGKANRLEATVRGKQLSFKAREEFSPESVSSTGAAQGTLVFAGYGIQASSVGHEDYNGLDVKGKVVVALEGTPPVQQGPNLLRAYQSARVKARTAKEQGAVALILVQREDAPLPPLSFGRGADSGIPVVTMRRKAAERLLAACGASLDELWQNPKGRPLEEAAIAVQTEVVQKYGATANILGVVEGTDPQLKEEYIVIGAHMDHLGWGYQGGSLYTGKLPAIHYGADDNASGTAGLLELAQYFAANPTKRSLLFIAFSGEEIGLLGSAHYTRNPIVPLEKTVAMLNMDMIGRLRDNNLSVIGVDSSPAWRPLLEELNADAGFNLSLGGGGFGAGSDHASFLARKIPVLFFFTGMHREYHTPADKPETINAPGTARVVRFVAQVTERIANASERITYSEPRATPRRTPTAAERPERGVRAYVGTIPDYSEDVKGLRLSGVREGSPAQKAGLRSGDVIVRFGSYPVQNIYDYMDALNRYKPGDTVTVVVVRDGEEVELTLTIEARSE